MIEKLNKNNFIRLAREVHGDKYNYDKSIYVKAKDKVIITCPIHGEFEQRPQDHILKGCGCPKCKVEKIIQTHSYTKEQFLTLANKVHNNKYDYSQMHYVNYSTKIKIICPIHGEFYQNPRDHLYTTGCPKCGKEKANTSKTYTTQEFIQKATKTHFNKYDYSKVNYIKSNQKVCIICPEHGEFWQTPASHLQGEGCSKCRLVGQTKLYNKLKEAFPDLDIIFEADSKVVNWIGNQRIDIYIPKVNIAIELMGPQHYKEIPYFKKGSSLKITQERDNRKRIKCKQNNCSLYELKYYYTKEDFNNLVKEVTQKLEELQKKFYSEEISETEKNQLALEAGKLLVNEILYNTQDNTNKLL